MDFLKIQNIDLYSYTISLASPLIIKEHIIEKRQGYIIKLTADNGLSGYGDIIPLPALHDEALDEIPILIGKFAKSLLEYIPQTDLVSNRIDFAEKYMPPSVRFGVESAILNLVDLELQNRDQKKFFSELMTDIKLNSLIDPREGSVEEAVIKSIKDGFTCIKIKTGRQPLDTDIKMIKRVCQLAGESITLRLDSNRSWSLADAKKFCTEIPVLAIEYLEEPLREPAALEDLYKEVPLPFAVDESLTENDPHFLLEREWIQAIVVKPSVCGGIFKTIEYMQQAAELNKKVIISDTYQSGVGVAMLARIAAIPTGRMAAAGLDTYSRLKEDILTQRLEIKNGRINLMDVQNKSRRLNFKMLTHHELY